MFHQEARQQGPVMMSMMMGSTSGYSGVVGAPVLVSPGSCSPTSNMANSLSSMGLQSPESYRAPLSPALSDSSNSNPHGYMPSHSPPPSHTRGAPKECHVCGDVAKSMHFGGQSCDSCKAFFRRSVQNNAYKGFSCPYDKKCIIGVSSRKACQFCRFEKCIAIGMEKSWVMTEMERKKLMQQRINNKQKKDPPAKPTENSAYALNEEDRSEIALIVSLYQKAYAEIPYEDFLHQESLKDITANPGSGSVLGPWITFCKRMAYFFSLFNEFSELSSEDQFLLLKTALTAAGLIMGSVVYDGHSGKWSPKAPKSQGQAQAPPSQDDASYQPTVAMSNVQKIISTDLVARVDSFFRKFQQICIDEKMAMILILISLYSPELMGLEAKETVQKLQERYIGILEHYIRYIFKEKSALMFPKAIVSLADIRELAERTYQMKINGASLANEFGKGTPIHHGAVNSLGEGISGLKLDGSVPSEAMAKRARLAATGDARDMIYQKIWSKVIDQMHITSMKVRAPSLLPFIIPIVKKLMKQEGQKEKHRGSRRAITSNHRLAVQKHGSKRRLVEFKRNQHAPRVHVKEEAQDMEFFEEPMADVNTQLFSSSIELSSGVSQDSQSSHPFMDNDSTAFPTHSPRTMIRQASPQYCNSPPLYANNSSPLDMGNECSDQATGYLPHPLGLSSPDHNLMQGYPQPCIPQMDDQLGGMTSFQQSASPPIQMHQQSYPSMSSPEAYSPYSSSSSSSSVDDNPTAFSDLEMDVLTSLIECVTSVHNTEDAMDMIDDRQVKEVIPLPLLTELQRKLYHG